MKQINRVKDKYIFYNDKKEVLVLYNGRYTFFVPGLIEGQSLDCYGEGIKYIIDLLTEQKEKIYLNKVTEKFPILKPDNTKLKKVMLYEIKNYFSCYTKFTKEICCEINKFCFKEGIVADLVLIDDLKQIIKKNGRIKVDRFILDSLEELDKRLSYKKY